MNTLTINPKFKVEDKVYIIKQERVQRNCPICEGSKKIEYNGKQMTCPECGGAGSFDTKQLIHKVQEDLYDIKTIKATIHSDNVSIRYKGYVGTKTCDRAEENLYSTFEEASLKCIELNRFRKHVNFKDIIIDESFAKTIPSADKISKRIEEYKTKGAFETEIVVNSDNVLVDGYSTYLVCKMLGKDIIRVIVS